MRREINLSGRAKYFVAQCEKTRNSLTKKYFVKSTNSLEYILFSKTVTFTKFLIKMREREFP